MQDRCSCELLTAEAKTPKTYVLLKRDRKTDACIRRSSSDSGINKALHRENCQSSIVQLTRNDARLIPL